MIRKLMVVAILASVDPVLCAETNPAPEWDCPNAIILKVDETKIFCSGLQPLIIRLRGLNKATKAVLSSKMFSKALNVSQPVKDGCAELSINYKEQIALDQPDTINISFVESEEAKETFLAKLLVFPVRAELWEKGSTRDAVSTHIDFMLDPGFDGKGAFQYQVRPWDPLLAKHLFFAALPAYFCDGKLTFSQQQPDKELGETNLLGEAKAPGMSAITVMLGKELWLECCPKRFSVYLDFQGNAPLKAPPPTKEEAVAADKALDEIFPAPRDEKTEKGVQQLRDVFHAHGVPYLPEGLKSLSEYTRSTAIKNSAMPWEDLIMAAAEHSIRFAPPPPKPSHDEKP